MNITYHNATEEQKAIIEDALTAKPIKGVNQLLSLSINIEGLAENKKLFLEGWPTRTSLTVRGPKGVKVAVLRPKRKTELLINKTKQ